MRRGSASCDTRHHASRRRIRGFAVGCEEDPWERETRGSCSQHRPPRLARGRRREISWEIQPVSSTRHCRRRRRRRRRPRDRTAIVSEIFPLRVSARSPRGEREANADGDVGIRRRAVGSRLVKRPRCACDRFFHRFDKVGGNPRRVRTGIFRGKACERSRPVRDRPYFAARTIVRLSVTAVNGRNEKKAWESESDCS